MGVVVDEGVEGAVYVCGTAIDTYWNVHWFEDDAIVSTFR